MYNVIADCIFIISEAEPLTYKAILRIRILGGDFLNKSNQKDNGELQEVNLDLEWVYLLLKAKKAGIKAEEVRRFFNENSLQVM